jgi:hypothetical protein
MVEAPSFFGGVERVSHESSSSFGAKEIEGAIVFEIVVKTAKNTREELTNS